MEDQVKLVRRDHCFVIFDPSDRDVRVNSNMVLPGCRTSFVLKFERT